MTSKILTIYDQITTLLASSLTGHIRLPNPYEVNSNTFLHLDNAYGLGVGPGSDTQRYVGCLVTWEQTYNIVLVRRIVTTQNNTAQQVIIEKSIFEDWDTLRKAFYNNSTLNGYAYKTTLRSHDGISFIDGNQQKFLALELELITEYQDTPT